VGDEDAEAPVAQLRGGGVEALVDRLERRLQEHPARVQRALGDRLQLALRQARDHLVPQLPAYEQA